MTNKSGNIGTKTATATCRALAGLGFPHAERRDETQPDQGDIAGMIGVAVQVKGGHAAEDASLELIGKWLGAAEQQRQAARADVGILVCKRKGVGYANAHQWWAFFTEGTYRTIIGFPNGHAGTSRIVMRVTLADAAWLLRLGGWGEPLPGQDGDPGGFDLEVIGRAEIATAMETIREATAGTTGVDEEIRSLRGGTS
jgi:hypothetical protein